MTKPPYSELELQTIKTATMFKRWQDAETELARVRGLLQRLGADHNLEYCDCLFCDFRSEFYKPFVSQGAESADIGKLGAADKSAALNCPVHGRGYQKVCTCKAGSAETGGREGKSKHLVAVLRRCFYR